MSVIAVDVMGGDNAPQELVKGCVEALKITDDCSLILFGKEEEILKILNDYEYDKSRLSIFNTDEVIETAESPVAAIRNKKNSSMVRALTAVSLGQANGVVSAGNTGALLAGGQLIVGRIKGVNRSPLATLLPTENGKCVLMLDLGANVDIKANNILQFARLGSIYMQRYLKIENLPKVAIVNIGAEEEKGNALVKESFPLLRECKDINFIGSVESGDILKGQVDVAVCEAFVGNAILKTIENTAAMMIRLVKKALKSNLKSKIGAALSMTELKKGLKIMDISEYGGAVMLGLNGLIVKAHGSSDYREIKNAILQCVEYDKNAIKQVIEENFDSDD